MTGTAAAGPATSDTAALHSPPIDAVLVQRVRGRLALRPDDATRPAAVRAAVAQALAAEGVAVSPDKMAVLVRDLADHVSGLGPLETLLRQPGVTDVMVNGPNEVWVERDGHLQRTAVQFADAEAVLAAVRRVVGPLGGRIDRTRPFVDAKLGDGSRLHAVAAPIAAEGPLVTLRRFDARTISWQQLIASDAIPGPAAEELQKAVSRRDAIVVCGRTGTGKTTLLQRLVGDVAAEDRIVLIEDSPELRPTTPHLVRLETRPPSVEGSGAVDMSTLVRQALRMRPDRIVVGEVRGTEIADVLQALITGHEGCMTTVHASSAAQALIRLEGMALLAGLPLVAAQAQIGSAVDTIVALDRGPDGQRGVVEIASIAVDRRLPVARTVWQRTSWS